MVASSLMSCKKQKTSFKSQQSNQILKDAFIVRTRQKGHKTILYYHFDEINRQYHVAPTIIGACQFTKQKAKEFTKEFNLDGDWKAVRMTRDELRNIADIDTKADPKNLSHLF